MTTQESPFAIQMEPTEGCNLSCNFCAIASIGMGRVRRGNEKFMDLAIAQSVAQQVKDLGWNPRIEYAMHGEPTLHPNLPDLISPFRGYYTLVTSNGGGLLQDTVAKVRALFDAGLNTLALDDYETNRMIERFLENAGHTAGATPFHISFYPDDRTASPHTRSKGHRVVILKDLTEATAGTHSDVHNSAGDAGLLDARLNTQRCAKPFREISVRWDGNVAICCNDWPGDYKVGNVMDDGLEAIWNHERFQAARNALYHGRRDLIPTCDGCTAKSYRVGLLPDKKGRVDLPMPTFDDSVIIEEAMEGEPFTPRVRRRATWDDTSWPTEEVAPR